MLFIGFLTGLLEKLCAVYHLYLKILLHHRYQKINYRDFDFLKAAFILVLIAIDRYLSIVGINGKHRRLPHPTLFVFICYVLSISGAIPTFLGVDEFEFVLNNSQTNSSHKYCGPVVNWWPEVRLIRSIFCFFVPVLFMFICYFPVLKFLRAHFSMMEKKNISGNSSQSKKKVLRLVVGLMTCFILSWLPYHAGKIYSQMMDPTLLACRIDFLSC